MYYRLNILMAERNLQLAKEGKQLSQRGLAEELDVSPTTVNKLYNGRPMKNKRPDNQASALNEDIWNRGERMIALASGGAFLGGLIAQVPGAAIGAFLGATFGWFEKPQ